MKTGLVLEGGAMRGLFSAGVLDVFLEEEITFDGMVGTSAGAVFGCNFKSKQQKRSIRYNMRFGRHPQYASFRNLVRTGDYYGTEFAYHRIPNELDVFDRETYIKNPIDFYICATDIVAGEPVYFKSEKGDEYDIEWMRASASMPLFSNIVEIDGYKLLDGGITDSIPLRFMEDTGYEKNVVILTQPIDYEKKKNKVMPLIRAKYRKYPKMVEAMAHRHEEYNETLDYIHFKSRQGSVFVIQPQSDLKISRVESDPDKLKKVYITGRKTAQKQIKKVKEFLKCEV